MRINGKKKLVRWVIRLCFMPLTAWALLACGLAGGPAYTTETQQVDGLTIAFERPERAELLQTYDLRIRLTDPSGQPIDGARVFVDMDMPAMPMPHSQPLADPLGDGRYALTTAFSMEGDWTLQVNAKVGDKEYIATFDQQVVLQGG